MVFWLILPVLTFLAAAFVVVPVLRTNAARFGRGAILGLTIGLAAIVAIPAIALYAFVGRPDLASVKAGEDRIANGAAQAPTPAAGMGDIIQRLKETVQRDPKDADAWQNLGWAYMHIRQPADAAEAYRHAVSLAPSTTEYLSALAEAEVQAGDGKIRGGTLAEFKRAAAANTADARARFYLGLYKDQQGDHKGAIADWIALLKSAGENAAWAPHVRRVVEQVAAEEHLDIRGELPPEPIVAAPSNAPSGPTAEQVAAAQQMSATDRNAMIRTMVDKLDSELKQNPHDSEGWQRLMRARMVLGEKDKALAAYRAARDAFAQEPAQLAIMDNAARSLGIRGG